jgi:hypothetical protein
MKPSLGGNPQVGDLVIPEWHFRLDVYEKWERDPKKIGMLRTDEVGLVLESQEDQGNGCKILFQGDKVGWVNINFLKRLT